MESASGQLVIIFNGEIYNHQALRAELSEARSEAVKWRGHSDTEVLLECIEQWGLEIALNKTVGMFALALWDKRKRSLQLARDRIGEKPLYYGWIGAGSDRVFAFASELKALQILPGFDGTICRRSLEAYTRFNYVPAPLSIYKHIYKLLPGCILTVSAMPTAVMLDHPLEPGERYRSLSLSEWYSLGEVARKGIERGIDQPFENEQDAVRQLESQLTEAVQVQSAADVPLGAFLSGGIDSSTIVALMQQQANKFGRPPISTFTIGFDEPGYDEAPFARAVAKHLGTDHHEIRLQASDALDLIPLLPTMYDEPFGDSSQIPTHLVCVAAKKHVTVALGGDGGDELFGGYNRYFWAERIWNRIGWLPFPARQALGAMISATPLRPIDAAGRLGGTDQLGDKLQKLAYRLKYIRNLDDLYASLVTEWHDPAAAVIGRARGGPLAFDVHYEATQKLPLPNAGRWQQRMMLTDTQTYLPDDILCKLDRAAMSCSLETRSPFLDHRVLEFAWRLPMNFKLRGGVGKWALREVLFRHIPQHLVDRPKSGFALPIGWWLRGPLREWAEHLLSRELLEQDGYFNADLVRRSWQEHISGRRVRTGQLWGILMFQMWKQRQSEA